MSKTLSLSRQALERGRKESFTLMCEPELERHDSSQRSLLVLQQVLLENSSLVFPNGVKSEKNRVHRFHQVLFIRELL